MSKSSEDSTESSISHGNGCKVPKFLRALYTILTMEDPSIIKWIQNQELRPHQVTAFHILDLCSFEQKILPKYFKHAKFASFQRQLNNFGFRKWTKTQSSGVCTFSHNCFPPDPKQIGMICSTGREVWKKKQIDGSSHRRRVGNGITMEERKLQQQVQQQRGIPKPFESFTNNIVKNARIQVKCRNPTMWSSNRPLYNNTINIGTYHGPTVATVPYEGGALMKGTLDNSLLPIEPWAWSTAPSSSSAPLPPLEMPPLYTSEGLPESAYNGDQRQHQISPSSTEEFTFDHWMLFVE